MVPNARTGRSGVGRIVIVFAIGHPGFDSLGEGWSDPEGDRTWAVGPRSTLVLPRLVPMPDGYTATLNVQGYEPGGRLQALRVLCNGADLGEQELSHEDPLVLRLDAAMLDGHGRTELAFLPRHHSSPAAGGHSEDRRELSFSLAWISFSARMPPADVIEPPIVGIDDAALMMGFESLGDDCEFGFAQRAAGAEPLSLLRFGGIRLHRLDEALAAGFAGIDDPAELGTSILGGRGLGEYMIVQNRYRYVYHTFVNSWEMERDTLIAREVARLTFCRRKLLEDLEDGDKIFVVKSSAGAGLRLDQVAPVAERVARLGGAVTFWASASDDDHPPGTLDWHGPTLLEGRLDRLCTPGEATQFTPYWLPLCRRVHRAVAARKGRHVP